MAGVNASRDVMMCSRVFEPDVSCIASCMTDTTKCVSCCADEDWDNLDWSKAPAIQEMPVTSAILSPTPGHAIKAKDGKVAVTGYALAGGGRAIIRVDVSADGGKTWTPAKLLPVPDGLEQGYRKNWAWRHWEARLCSCACAVLCCVCRCPHW